jgi:ligand-binding sensor domain-containing protein
VINALACLVRGGLPAGLLWLLATVAPARAANATWHARAWQSDDGLPNNTVAGLAQTSDGYLWLGTPSGLVRFEKVENLKVQDSPGLAEPKPEQ